MFRELKPYGDYRASGTVWLPPLPTHWTTRRLKTVVAERNIKGFPEEPLLAATQSRGVIRKADYGIRTVEAQKSLETLKLVEVDDFVISLRSFQGGIERSYARGIISPAYTVLESRGLGDRNYLTLLFKTREFVDALRLTVTGIREGQNIEYPRLARDLVPVPPADEQAAIVKYLGHAHARIDRAIAAKRKLIALLEEQKQAIIHQAVTRGLDPTVPLKHSVIPWLGWIPAHWSELRLKNLARFRSGAGFPVSEQGRAGNELPFFRVSDMNAPGNGQWLHMTDSSVTNDDAQRLGALVFPPGTIVFPKVGGALLTNKRRRLAQASCIDNNVMAAILPAGANGDYVNLVLSRIDLGRFVNPGPVPAIGEGQVGRIRVAVPPDSEREGILDLVYSSTSGVVLVQDQAQREIALLREFRTRLTSDVVTGQVDVREIAASLPDFIEPSEADADSVDDDSLDDVEPMLEEADA